MWFHTDFTEKAPKAERKAPKAERKPAAATTEAGRPSSEAIGRGAGRVVGGGVNSLKRWKDSFNSGADGDE